VSPWRRALLWALFLLLLLAVFSLYRQPAFMRDLADLVWSCF
jgi:hypothetical protein